MTKTEPQALDPIVARVVEIIESSWSTDALAGMALAWYETSAAIVAGTGNAQPIWRHISSSEQAAREFYASVDADTRRELAADALASSGWTLSAINYRKS